MIVGEELVAVLVLAKVVQIRSPALRDEQVQQLSDFRKVLEQIAAPEPDPTRQTAQTASNPD